MGQNLTDNLVNGKTYACLMCNTEVHIMSQIICKTLQAAHDLGQFEQQKLQAGKE